MLNFKCYLTEAKEGYFAPWHITDPEKARKWLTDEGYSSVKANKDGSISVTSSLFNANKCIAQVDTPEGRKTALILKFKRAKFFAIVSPNLFSLWGMPDVCKDGVNVVCANLKSLEHLTPEIGGILTISCSRLEELNCGPINCDTLSLINIGKLSLASDWKQFSQFKVRRMIMLNTAVMRDLYQCGILGLCKVLQETGATKYHLISTDIPEYPELYKVIQIVNEHYKNILNCQEILIDNGLEKYANF